MGFLDRLKKINFTKPVRKESEEQTEFVLRQGDETRWTEQLVHHLGLEKDFERFLTEIDRLRSQLTKQAEVFTQDDALDTIPERARTMNALHAKEYAGKIERLAQHTTFDDLFDFEEDHQDFFDTLNEFRDRRKKNVSALKEYMHEKLQQTDSLVKELEDNVVTFIQTLEEKNFPSIQDMQETLERMERIDEQTARYERLLEQLEEELEKTKEKRTRLEQKMKDQRSLVRNQQALRAFENLSNIEQELDEIVHKYENTFKDTGKYYTKYPQTPPIEAAQLLTDLPKDPARTLVDQRQEVHKALEVLSEELKDKSIGNLHDRIENLKETVMKDAARVREILPEQKELRKDIMKDVATVQIYDQQQFLLRAKRDEKEIENKMHFIREQLESGTRTVLEQELKTLAIRVGATVEGEPSNLVMDEEIDDAEETLEEEEKILERAEEELDRDMRESQESAEQSVKSAEQLIREVEDEMAEETPEEEEEILEEPPEETKVFVGQPEESGEPERSQDPTQEGRESDESMPEAGKSDDALSDSQETGSDSDERKDVQ